MMGSEEKILELLEQMNTRLASMESGQAALDGRMGRFESTQGFIKLGVQNLDHKQLAIEGRLGRIETEQEQLRDYAQRTAILLETEYRQKLELLYEGHQSILDQLTPKERFEAIEADISVLKLAVRTLTAELAELKQAQ